MPSFEKNKKFLAPEDAIHPSLSAQSQSASYSSARSQCIPSQSPNNGNTNKNSRKGRHRNKFRSTNSRGQKEGWKKLLWVKQSYPDNYTDQETFLEHLQRNPRLQPYDFWPLVADSTVIVQHVCSVIIFVVCFVGIFKEHVSPIAVVGWGSIATLLGWILWDSWMERREDSGKTNGTNCSRDIDSDVSSLVYSSGIKTINTSSSTVNIPINHTKNFGSSTVANTFYPHHSHSTSISSVTSITSVPRVSKALFPSDADYYPNQFSHRTSRRLSTVKSALLIYFTLLGLSPILKSLTRSTSSDSIWTMSFLLFTVNIFFFDYGPSVPLSSSIISSGGVGRKKNIPASLSTNAALMASTVLASRLPSTGQVFSLTLFSIEVFGLFPVFRNDLRQRSWRGHVFLTTLLILGAGGGVGLILSIRASALIDNDSSIMIAHQGYFLYKNFGLGMLMGVLLTTLAMGGCSWWLIDLQKYKNEIHGPWDPARPVIRRAWGDEY